MNRDLSKYHILQGKLKLSNTEVLVLDYIYHNIELVKQLSIREIALNCFCSTTIIMNLARKLGYKSYKDMVYLIEDELKGNQIMLQFNERYLSKFTNLNKALIHQFTNLLTTHKTIYISGIGFCANIADYIQEKLMILNFNSFDTWHHENYLNPLDQKPLLIFISKSGETTYLLELALIAQERGYDIISFTHQKENTLQKYSTLNFALYDNAPLDESNRLSNSFYPLVLLLFEHLIDYYLISKDFKTM
ncbi:MAG: MurR/RpiR family transcriptional regulator [Bacilli bacterium]